MLFIGMPRFPSLTFFQVHPLFHGLSSIPRIVLHSCIEHAGIMGTRKLRGLVQDISLIKHRLLVMQKERVFRLY